jgi:hypothetical protein
MKIRLVVPDVNVYPTDRPHRCRHCQELYLHPHGIVCKPACDQKLREAIACRYSAPPAGGPFDTPSSGSRARARAGARWSWRLSCTLLGFLARRHPTCLTCSEQKFPRERCGGTPRKPGKPSERSDRQEGCESWAPTRQYSGSRQGSTGWHCGRRLKRQRGAKGIARRASRGRRPRARAVAPRIPVGCSTQEEEAANERSFPGLQDEDAHPGVVEQVAQDTATPGAVRSGSR